ncbi:MAG: glycosyltransferase, partial [Actinobacteria bacterium]|nr:glycosyltransferase [Actinomycetota bacterium]
MDISYFLSVVIPIYNEEHRIKDTLERVVSYLSEKNFNWELILVNDGSTDRSVDIIEKFKQKSENSFVNSNTGSYRVIILNNNENRGKGYAVRKGILNSCGRYVLFTDADNSVPIEEVEKLLNYLNDGFDIAIGSKGLRESMVIKPRLIRW